MRKLLAVLLLSVTVTGNAGADAARTVIGVLIGANELDTLARWTPTADYLTQKIPERRFVILPLDRNGMDRAAARHELDFILTDPGQYVELQTRYGITALATMQYASNGKLYAESSAAIVARSDRLDILRLSQLKGKSFMAVSPDDFAGYQLIYWELNAHIIDPSRDFQLIFSGTAPEQIVYAVRNRSVDAGVVRTGVLEHMAREGKIDLNEFRVLHPHVTPGFPFAASTEAYPERPFARAQHTPDELAQRVASALRGMPPQHSAARAGGYAGWTAPLDYQPVHELLAGHHVCPYEDSVPATIADTIHQYRHWVIAGIAFLLLSAGFSVYVLWLNRRLRLSKRILEIQFAERARAEEALRRSARALRALHGITSKHSLSFEKKVQALLGLGRKQFGLPIGILGRVEGEKYEIVEVNPSDGPIPKGRVFSVGDTYCRNALESKEPVSFEHAAQSEWRSHPAYEQCQLETYLGIRVEVQGEAFGTLNFVSPQPRTVPFTSTDKEILKLMAQWLGGEIGRQRAETQMRKLSGALEQTADAVMIVNRSGVIEYVNPAFERITGYPQNEIIGNSPRVLRSGRNSDAYYRRLWKTILQGEAFHDTFVNRRKDGLLYYEEKTITPLKDEHGTVTHFVSTGKDVTKRRLAEERAQQRQAQMAHVQRVSAMGVMATSLAHELNQPLAAIVNYAQGCIHRLRDGEVHSSEFLTALEHIAAEGSRSGEIIRRVREFLRKGKPARMRADINQIVHDATDLAGPEARQKNVDLRLELTGELPPVLADAVQIEQVVLNLVHNAIEAIDGAQCPRREVTVQTGADPKNGVEVTVRDTGPGFAVKNSDHLFAPFFTTRADGMGMGLSISRSIIEAHGDRLQAFANADGGATFRFALPTVEGGRLQ